MSEKRLINRVPGFEDVAAPAVPSFAEIMGEREDLCECGGSFAEHRLSSNHNFTPVGPYPGAEQGGTPT